MIENNSESKEADGQDGGGCCENKNESGSKYKTLSITLDSTLTCPICDYKKQETMPTNACQWFYECVQCQALLKPLAGDCCVYCSYGSVPCPPIQQEPSNKGSGNCC